MLRWGTRRHRQDVRDGVLFLAGLAGVAHETFYAAEPRETLLILFAAMMGLPAFLRLDESQAKPPDKEQDETGSP